MSNITWQNYFVYKGVKYGKGTKIKFTWEFNQRFLIHTMSKNKYWRAEADYRVGNKYYEPAPSWFWQINIIDGKEDWVCGYLAGTGIEIVPDRDIEEILVPAYYVEPLTPRQLVKKRLKDGTWVNYIGAQTVFYVLCLIISPIFREWYLIWTIGLYLYLRTSYLTLSEP